PTTGLLLQNTRSTIIYPLLELARTCILVACTYMIYTWELFFYLQLISLLKFWSVIIAARLSEKWIINSNIDKNTLINGIIEFDQKTAVLSTDFSIQQRSLSKRFLNTIYISLLVYFIGYELFQVYLFPPKTINIYTTMHYLFNTPFIIDFDVLISSYFFLMNLNTRFQTLLDFLKFFNNESDFPNEWTHSEIAMSMERIRILHSELSELLKIFSLGYGPLLLSFFVFNFMNLLIQFFLSVCIQLPPSKVSSIKPILNNILPFILNIQVIIFTMSIINAVSLIHDKRRKMISYLRLYRISKLHADIKRQVKMFMLQLSFFELDEISAFGFFNINLNIVMSTIVLLLTGLITLLQMKKHIIIMNMINSTMSFAVEALINYAMPKYRYAYSDNIKLII
ncbi:Gustatory receptor, partial [Aphis craccivora]